MKKYLLTFLLFTCFFAQEHVIDLKGIKIDLKEKTIKIEGIVNMQKGLVELLATAPGGKEHESVLKLYCNPALLHTALLLLDLEIGGGGKKQGDSDPIYGGEMYIYVSWKDKKNKQHIVRAENLVKNERTKKVMKPCRWIFTGSRFTKDQRTGKSIYIANINGILIATFYDPDAIVNNPLPERSDDTVFYANNDLLPEENTPIKVTFSLSPINK